MLDHNSRWTKKTLNFGFLSYIFIFWSEKIERTHGNKIHQITTSGDWNNHVDFSNKKFDRLFMWSTLDRISFHLVAKVK